MFGSVWGYCVSSFVTANLKFLTLTVKHIIFTSMTIHKAYISNLSPQWPVRRQHEILASMEGAVTIFSDELKASERRGYRIDGLKDRQQMLRPTTRNGEQIIFVASLAVLARNAEDLMVVLAQASERNATIRDLTAKIDIKPHAKAKELKVAAQMFADARKRAAETERSDAGGKRSAEIRKAEAKAKAETVKDEWPLYNFTSEQLARQAGICVNTLKEYLGNRRDGRRSHQAAQKRKEKRARTA